MWADSVRLMDQAGADGPGSPDAENAFDNFAAHDDGWAGLTFGKLVQR
jgi:hypothetical protein